MPNLFPTTGVEEAKYNPYDAIDADNTGENVKKKTVQFDFEKHEFIISPTGKMKTVTGSNAWAEWCIKALCTERFEYLIYSSNYGEELDTLIAKSFAHDVAESEIRRMVKECLKSDPRTASVGRFSFKWINDGVMFSCVVTNTLGEAVTISRTVVR